MRPASSFALLVVLMVTSPYANGKSLVDLESESDIKDELIAALGSLGKLKSTRSCKGTSSCLTDGGSQADQEPGQDIRESDAIDELIAALVSLGKLKSKTSCKGTSSCLTNEGRQVDEDSDAKDELIAALGSLGKLKSNRGCKGTSSCLADSGSQVEQDSIQQHSEVGMEPQSEIGIEPRGGTDSTPRKHDISEPKIYDFDTFLSAFRNNPAKLSARSPPTDKDDGVRKRSDSHGYAGEASQFHGSPNEWDIDDSHASRGSVDVWDSIKHQLQGIDDYRVQRGSLGAWNAREPLMRGTEDYSPRVHRNYPDAWGAREPQMFGTSDHHRFRSPQVQRSSLDVWGAGEPQIQRRDDYRSQDPDSFLDVERSDPLMRDISAADILAYLSKLSSKQSQRYV